MSRGESGNQNTTDFIPTLSTPFSTYDLTLSEPTYFEHFHYPQKLDDISDKKDPQKMQTVCYTPSILDP